MLTVSFSVNTTKRLDAQSFCRVIDFSAFYVNEQFSTFPQNKVTDWVDKYRAELAERQELCLRGHK